MDKIAQLEELDSLKSIYYNEEFQVIDNSDKNGNIQAIFWAFFTLGDDYHVKYLDNIDSTEPSYLTVKHLPPISLMLILPEDYPSTHPPEFVISCQWLPKSKISLLCEKLDNLWSDFGAVEIIYVWCDFLKNESLSFLGCDKELDLTELSSQHLSFLQKMQSNKEEKQKWREKNFYRFKENKPKEPKALNENSTSGSKSVSENSKLSESITNDNSCSPDALVKLINCKTFKENHNKFTKEHPYIKRSNENKNPEQSCSKNIYDKRAVLNLSLKMSPIRVLENYNAEREKVEFSRNFYTCNICFSDKLGKDCTKFHSCNHVFCINCIRSYFTVNIKDGTVQSIKCPELKCTTEALPSQVKEIVSEELFAHYDSVLLNTALDTLNDIIYCPRQICQYPVSWDPEEKMASCPNCQYVFCVTCKMVYHGVEPCHIKSGEVKKLIEQYENGSADVRAQLESKYGRKHLEALVNNSKTENWIKDYSKACPRCETAIEKSQGCNKMLCWKCNANFCWLCCSILDVKDPYLHFRDPDSGCRNKLFYLAINLDDDEDDWDWVEEQDDDDEF